MKTTLYHKAYVLILILLNMSCGINIEEKNILVREVESVKKHFAPDKRTALFNIDVLSGSSNFTLVGESNLPNAVDSLKAVLHKKGIEVEDHIKILPSLDLKGKTKAVINISAANLRSNPKHSAELATQAILGTEVNVLKNDGDWYLIQTPDDYLAWVDSGGIQLMNEESLLQWTTSKKIIYTKTYGHAYNTIDEESIVSDLVAGNILKFLNEENGFYKVEFPDGRKAFVRKNEAEDYNTWLSNLDFEADSLIAISKTLIGVPYLWGGTSTKGVDCSGFTKTIYYLNGMVIPRDASQQVHAGKSIDSISDFSKLEKGDLLFFGRKATETTTEKVVHVGMWIGDNKFIHSSNMVRISSVDKNSPNFDEFNVGRYLRSKRILNMEDKNIINLKKRDTIKG
ncbi:C40 family peptidase [Maribacter hydrothermalis]|uniref:Glycoside hydrolase n=1 Tax=Maribacter hydrothermalis TaxID=1836467 RepID=A0A1B7Z4C7_9FLAO|nr:C40 family peptidase [Maribacter hydrothermalis]APQ17309.1 glycoside hydrolase [Maribacter hydrothermalis]OBR37569.1 glycoside hydrolase [Maribacter hydrothermalis]